MRKIFRVGTLLAVVAFPLTGCTLVQSYYDLWFGPPAVASIADMSGDVTVKEGEASAAEPATRGLGLHVGDIVTTDGESTARLEFAGGNVITMAERTSVLIRADDGTSAEIGAVLLSGSIKAFSAGGGVLLSIGTPYGLALLGDIQVELSIDGDGGITVLVGEIDLLLNDGTRRSIPAGFTMAIDGLVVPVGGMVLDLPITDIVLDAITVVLLGNPKQVQVKRVDTKQWKTPRKRETVGVGDTVRTRKANGTLVQMGEFATVELQSGTEFALATAGSNATQHKAKYAVDSGSALVKLDRQENFESEHEVVAAGNTVKVRPGLDKGRVQLVAGKADTAKVVVQFGEAELEDGTIIGAGKSANLKAGKLVGKITPLASTSVGMRAASSSIVYYHREIPPIAFSWKVADAEAKTPIEVARDRKFEKILFRAATTGGAFVHKNLGAGRYYWRVRKATNAEQWLKGTVLIKKGTSSDCTDCNRTNIIYDTGEKTVVYYQQSLPAISLRWKAVTGAAAYRIKLFRDGDFDNATVDNRVTETTAKFRSGKLSEGKYYWLVVSLDKDEKDLSTGRMNSLEIAYDNAISDLIIKAPKQSAKISSSRLVTTGEVPAGARLYVNGRSSGLDGAGRFRQTVSLSKGYNRVVYRTVAKDGIERFYLRDIYRR